MMYVGNSWVVHARHPDYGIVKEDLSTVETRYKNLGYTIGYGRVKAASGPKFNIGDTVRVITNLNVRICAGTDNNVCPEITDPDYLGYAPTGTIGVVLDGPTNADGYIWWEVDYGPGLYSGWSVEDGLEKVEDNTPPTVDAFSVTPDSVTLGDPFTISYTVSDTGGSGLKQVELWRAIDVGGVPDWGTFPIDNPKQTTPLSGQSSYSGSFSDDPPSVGIYWYGIHVVDNAGLWSVEPDPPGPIEVEVTSSCDGTDTSCGIWPNCDNCNADDGCYAYSNGCEIRDYYCYSNEVGCDYTYSNRHTDYYDSYVYYCSGDTVRKHRLFHDFYCDGGSCTDHTSWVDDQLVENCNNYDGWVDTGNTRWVNDPANECKEKEQKEQEYQDYTCSGGSCDYSVTDTKWTDTGNTSVMIAKF